MFCIPLPGSGQVASSKKEGTDASKKKKKKKKGVGVQGAREEEKNTL